MRAIWLIARRELAAYLTTMSGYVIVAVILALEGLAFNAFALGGTDKTSSEAVSLFFYFASGFTIVAALFLSMRLIAEERQTGTIALLYSSPVRDAEIVLGKFLSVMILLAAMMLVSIYMPALVMVNGKISAGHLGAGYFGLLLIGAATAAIGIFGSALSKNQVVAVIASGGIVLALLLCWLLSSVTEKPFSSVFTSLAFWNQHFAPFQSGIVHVRDVTYYGVVTYVALFASTRVLEARRWR